MDNDDDLDAELVAIVIFARNLLNLYAELAIRLLYESTKGKQPLGSLGSAVTDSLETAVSG